MSIRIEARRPVCSEASQGVPTPQFEKEGTPFGDSYTTVTSASGISPYTTLPTLGCSNFQIRSPNNTSINICYTIPDETPINGILTVGAKEVDADVKAAAAKVVPATVQIHVVSNKNQKWSGSGYILDNRFIAERFPGIEMGNGIYYVFTNHHVANDAKTITITTSDKMHKINAEVVMARNGALLLDEAVDGALLRIRVPGLKLATVEVANHRDYEAGDTVLTAGYPLGFPNISITKGIISQIAQETGQPIFGIQADAAINPGNSGGPLFTLDGKVIGTNTYTFRNANDMSFANSTYEQIDVLSKIWNSGRIVRGDLGLSFNPLDDEARMSLGLPYNTRGAVIASVQPGSEAEKLGLKRGDILTSIDIIDAYGHVTSTINISLETEFELTGLLHRIYSLQPGQRVKLNVLWKMDDGSGAVKYEAHPALVTVSELGSRKGVDGSGWGFAAEDGNNGIRITSVGRELAAAAGLKVGMTIVSIRAAQLGGFDPIQLRSGAEFQKMLDYLDRRGASELILYVRDGTATRKVVIKRSIGDIYSMGIVNGMMMAVA